MHGIPIACNLIMDIRDPSSSPHGAVFMPSLPETLTELVDEPFTPNLGADFEDCP